jgi:hypothetical protein
MSSTGRIHRIAGRLKSIGSIANAPWSNGIDEDDHLHRPIADAMIVDLPAAIGTPFVRLLHREMPRLRIFALVDRAGGAGSPENSQALTITG